MTADGCELFFGYLLEGNARNGGRQKAQKDKHNCGACLKH